MFGSRCGGILRILIPAASALLGQVMLVREEGGKIITHIRYENILPEHQTDTFVAAGYAPWEHACGCLGNHRRSPNTSLLRQEPVRCDATADERGALSLVSAKLGD